MAKSKTIEDRLKTNKQVISLSKKYPRTVSFLLKRVDHDTEFGLYLTMGTIISFGLLLVFLELLQDVVYKDPIVQADAWILNIVELFRSQNLDHIMLFFTYMGSWEAILVGTIFVSMVLYVLNRKRYLMTLLFSVVAGQLIIMALKTIVSRPRPTSVSPIVFENSFSFPSGHAFVVFSFFGLTAYFIYKHLRLSWQRVLIVVAMTLLVVIISFSRVYLGVHWPTDVLASYAAGGAWLTAMITSLEIREKRRQEKIEPYLNDTIVTIVCFGLFVLWTGYVFVVSQFLIS